MSWRGIHGSGFQPGGNKTKMNRRKQRNELKNNDFMRRNKSKIDLKTK